MNFTVEHSSKSSTFDSHCHHPDTGMEYIHLTDEEIKAQKSK